MARWVNVLKRTFSHLSEMVNYAMRATPAGDLKSRVFDEDDFKARVDVIINHWAQRKRGMITSIYKEEGMRYIEMSGDKGNTCQIAIDPIDPRIREFGVHVTDQKSRRRDLSASVEDLAHRLEEAYSTAQRWLNDG